MTSATDFKTRWEAEQYAADHGRIAAQATGRQLLARHVYSCAAEDMAILGLREIPDPRPEMWPVTGGTDEDRMARIDAWAKRHGVKAGTDEASGHYKAVLTFGAVRLEVYTVPERLMADRVRAAEDRLAALYGAVREDRDAAQAKPELAVAI